MTPELEATLVAKYPELFKDKNAPLTESLMAFGCECGDGWYNLIAAACAVIDHHVKNTPSVSSFRWSQIKEKYGSLRLYYYGGADDYILGVIDVAETLSGHTCEICGAPGRTNGGGWLMTRCETHTGK